VLLADGPSVTEIASLLAGIVSALAAAASGIVAAVVARRTTRRQAAELEGHVAPTTLEERLDELSKSMRQSARLVEQVSSELEARAATARRLQEEARTAEALATMHKEQADAVRRMLDAELVTQAKRIRGDSIKIGIASFIAGGGLTLAVTLFVHPFH
jgi:hypothetical protein